VAIGNPFGLSGTVIAGIISAEGRDIGARPYDGFLQIDAPIDKGNSGGLPAWPRQGRARPFDLLEKPSRPVSRERSSSAVVRNPRGALHGRGAVVGGEAFAVDRGNIVADARRQRGVAQAGDLDPTSNRAVNEYLAVLDDAAFGGATPVEPKFVSPTDPAARWTAASGGPAVYAYTDNYLIDLKHAVIMDVEATTAVRQAEVTAAKTMIDRTADRFDVSPSRLAADTGYGSAEMLGWLVDERAIEPHIPVFDKSERTDGTFSRADFVYDQEGDLYICPTGKQLRKRLRPFAVPRSGVTKDNTVLYRASQRDCGACALKARCCPNTPARKVPRFHP
jgi:hypothetical protein